jgi:hypothetical protein
MAYKRQTKSVRPPGIICDNCGEVCRPHFILGQCATCGGFICKLCYLFHLCIPRSGEEVRRMQPEYFHYPEEMLTTSV